MRTPHPHPIPGTPAAAEYAAWLWLCLYRAGGSAHAASVVAWLTRLVLARSRLLRLAGTPLHQLRSLVVLQGIPPPRVPRKASKRRSKRRSSSTIRTRSAAQRRGSSRNTKRAHKVRGASVGPSGDRTGGDTLRGRVWRVLLGVPPTACLEYPQWLALGASPQAADIDADVTRTFRGDADFEARVPQQSLTRVLNAFVHKARSMWPTPDGSGDDTATGGATTGGAITGGATGDGGDAASSVDDMEGWWQSDEEDGGAAGPTQATGNQQGRTAGSGDAAGERSAEPADPERHLSYGQGLNTLCGALLMAMPEREAFGTLVTLATRHCPRYYTGDKTVGVHEGCRLFGELLEQVRGASRCMGTLQEQASDRCCVCLCCVDAR